jgi:uncharacterized pyridoxamine 5'-phosphate oxidase family protein
MNEVLEFLKKVGTYYIATVDNNIPRVRPFGTINLFEGKLYIQTSSVKDIAKQLEKNEKTEICAFDGETWLRLEATLIFETTKETMESMLNAYPNLKPMYEGNPNSATYYLKDVTAKFYSFSSNEPKIIKF